MLFAGREVRIGKTCVRGLAYGPRPQAEGRAQDRGHSFSQYGPDIGWQITCLFFSVGNYFIRNICVDFFTEAVSHRACAFDVSVKYVFFVWIIKFTFAMI